ncbi:MAG TPA: hypothetical protein VKS21_08720, partial [Spirochaetota bacterium]|nr:hypothetical protein [Spirochaetota bacterium]
MMLIMKNKSYKTVFLLLLFNTAGLFSADLSPGEIIKKVDANETFTTIKYTGIMTIHRDNRRRDRVKKFKAVAKGREKYLIEFINASDKGTRYLKLGEALWIKSPF